MQKHNMYGAMKALQVQGHAICTAVVWYLALDLFEDEGEVGGQVANGHTAQSLRSYGLHILG